MAAIRLLISMSVIWAAPSLSGAQTWDPITQWSPATNTTAGRWEYGTSTVFGGPVTLFEQHAASASPAYDWWSHDAAFNGPVVGFNATGGTLTLTAPIDIVWPAEAVLVAPGGKGTTPRISFVRWIAPATGSYNITGHFSDLQAATTDMRILNNTAPIFSAAFASSAAHKGDAPFALTNVLVPAGAPIDFAVDSGGNDGNDVLGLVASIRPADVPEPSAAAVALFVACVARTSARPRRDRRRCPIRAGTPNREPRRTTAHPGR